MAHDDNHDSYVNKVRDLTRRYLQEVVVENERLRSFAHEVQLERDALVERLAALEKLAEAQAAERDRAAARLADIEAENRRYSSDFIAIEQQNSNLAQLYVASYRLHGTLVLSEVMTAVHEIVINLIGSEEFGIFELRDGRTSLVSSVGTEAATLVAGGDDGFLGRTMAEGRTCVADAVEAERFTVCIPLKVDGEVTGAITIFRLLPQKPGLEQIDHELLEMLATHAATALYSASLAERLRRHDRAHV